MPKKSSRPSSDSADTIVAVSSAAGSSLRAVVRLSGPRAIAFGGRLPGAVVCRAPGTYTREDVVEIHLPGSPPLVERLVADLVARGARPSRPGEFTLRAFLHGRLDLAQAEAVEELISSENEADGRAALAQLRGDFSRRLRGIEGDLLDLSADAEAAIDFVDQDIEILPVSEAAARAGRALGALGELLKETRARAVSAPRPTVALYGPPNAGKSSLFNALSGSDSIVTSIAGTTRDVLAKDVDWGIPVRLLDTAGDRAGGDLEQEAVRRAREAAREADLVLFVVDPTDWKAALPLLPRGQPAILVLNKCDLPRVPEVRTKFPLRHAVFTSATTGAGIGELKKALVETLSASSAGSQDGRFRVNFRQRALLLEAESALARASGAAPGLGMEFVCLDLRAALEALGAITGRYVEEELLDRIFSRFCLGK